MSENNLLSLVNLQSKKEQKLLLGGPKYTWKITRIFLTIALVT